MSQMICDLTKPTAQDVLDAELWEDDYHANIVNAAKVLAGAGHTDYRYVTQWTSGATAWETPMGRGVIVTVEGVIRGE